VIFWISSSILCFYVVGHSRLPRASEVANPRYKRIHLFVAPRSAGRRGFVFSPSLRAPGSTSVSRRSSVLGPSPLGGVDIIVRLFNVAEVISVSGAVSTGGTPSYAVTFPGAFREVQSGMNFFSLITMDFIHDNG
ncbi:hypothetical protein Tco_0357737, partial [Tanacetum coccineum]